jgi:hypothetical protein
MTIKELIEQLSKLDENLEVYTYTGKAAGVVSCGMEFSSTSTKKTEVAMIQEE